MIQPLNLGPPVTPQPGALLVSLNLATFATLLVAATVAAAGLMVARRPD